MLGWPVGSQKLFLNHVKEDEAEDVSCTINDLLRNNHQKLVTRLNLQKRPLPLPNPPPAAGRILA